MSKFRLVLDHDNVEFIDKINKYISNGFKSIDFDENNTVYDTIIKSSINDLIKNNNNAKFGRNRKYLPIVNTINIRPIKNKGVYIRNNIKAQYVANKIIYYIRYGKINIVDCLLHKYSDRNIHHNMLREICYIVLDFVNLIYNNKYNDDVEYSLYTILDSIENPIKYEPGKFIVFEGCDSIGKDYIFNYLMRNYKDNIIFTREPGGTKLSESIRDILLDKKYVDTMSFRTELLLYNASRAQHVDEVIIPALQSGVHVISNRFYHSSTIYQRLRKISNKDIYDVTLFATKGIIVPDLTICFYSSNFDIVLDRMENKSNKDRIEQEDIEFFKKVNDEYKNVKNNVVIKNLEGKNSNIETIDITDSNFKYNIIKLLNKYIW